MNNLFTGAGALLAGFAAGVCFFGGLWFTIQKGVSAKIPALWFVPSFFIRVVFTLLIFYYAGGEQLLRLLLCLGGFIIARFVVTRYTRGKQLKHSREEIA